MKIDVPEDAVNAAMTLAEAVDPLLDHITRFQTRGSLERELGLALRQHLVTSREVLREVVRAAVREVEDVRA